MSYALSFSPVSECAVLIQFNQSDSTQLSIFIGQVSQDIYRELNASVMNVTPSYNTILVDYLPHRISLSQLQAQLIQLVKLAEKSPATSISHNVIELPIYYHLDVGPDLKRLQTLGIDIETVIAQHTQTLYTIQAIGFAPGFAFLGDVVTSIQLPRHPTPRLQVPKGSVAIDENKTAVYPSASPGGWNIIGNCPIELYHPSKIPMTPFTIGGRVQFSAINKADFLALGGIISQEWQ